MAAGWSPRGLELGDDLEGGDRALEVGRGTHASSVGGPADSAVSGCGETVCSPRRPRRRTVE